MTREKGSLISDEELRMFPEAVSLSWRNMSVRVRQSTKSSNAWLPRSCRPHEDKVVLNNVSGCVTGGTFLAVVGASGSGKTTLLAAITKRLTGRGVSGDVLLNGRTAGIGLLSAVCGFVPQHDLSTETLTTAEHLSFMAAMVMDARTSAAGRARRVRSLMIDFGLTACAHSRLQVLSGGERKRLAVATRLLMSPPVLALDEPCSGLDAEAARSVLDILRREADRGRAVLCTVHQAAPDALELFNDILVLVGGRLAYHGPLQSAYHFMSRSGARLKTKCHDDMPPTLALTELLHQLSDQSSGAQRDARALCDAFANSELVSRPLGITVGESLDTVRNFQRPSWYTQFCWLAWRGVLDTRRKLKTHAINFALNLSTHIVLATAFVNVTPSSMAGVQGSRGLLYLITTEVVFSQAYGVFHTFPRELPVYLREARLYSPAAYYLSKALLLTPRSFVEPLLFLSVIYSLVDVTAGGGFLTFCALAGCLFMSALLATAYGSMLSALCKSTETVMLATLPIELLSLLTTGMFNTLRSLPVYLSWFKYLSIFHYCYACLSILFWRNVKQINCLPDVPCLSNGTEVLDIAGFDAGDLFKDILSMGMLILGFHFIGFLAILFRSKQQSAY